MGEFISAGGGTTRGDGERRADRIGEILAVGTRKAGSGQVELEQAPAPGEPTLRWRSRARSIEEIERELTRIWAEPNKTVMIEGQPGRHVAARTSVMNLVVIATRPEVGEHSAAIISRLTGRHPSRTLILSPADPDGPSWLDAQIQAHCILPRGDAPETCAEMIYLTAGGEAGRHLHSIIAPLLIHDLPVTVWWPGEPPFGSPQADDIFGIADRVVVDGSTWSGDGLERMARMARLLENHVVAVTDFALLRQSRWREAIASTFDDPDLAPYLRSLRRISVTYATHDESGAPGTTNVLKPVYHVAWLASRLGLYVEDALHPADDRGAAGVGRTRAPGRLAPMARGLVARLRASRGDVAVVVRPVSSEMPAGTTLRVELLCERRGSELRVDVTPEAETVDVNVWQDGVGILERSFLAARRSEADLLAETVEATGPDSVAMGAMRAAAALAGASRPSPMTSGAAGARRR
jgi:hypothetical protein